MWLFTTLGFHSVVQHRDNAGQVFIRARFKDDLVRLCRRFTIPEDSVLDTPDADYGYRIAIPKKQRIEIARSLAESVDYDNFKTAAHSGDRVKDGALLQIWRVMRKAQKQKGI